MCCHIFSTDTESSRCWRLNSLELDSVFNMPRLNTNIPWQPVSMLHALTQPPPTPVTQQRSDWSWGNWTILKSRNSTLSKSLSFSFFFWQSKEASAPWLHREIRPRLTIFFPFKHETFFLLFLKEVHTCGKKLDFSTLLTSHNLD